MQENSKNRNFGYNGIRVALKDRKTSFTFKKIIHFASISVKVLHFTKPAETLLAKLRQKCTGTSVFVKPYFLHGLHFLEYVHDDQQ